MQIVIDMNLSPRWVVWLHAQGMHARHWSELGPADAPDENVLSTVRAWDACLLTCDLDFGRIVALAGVTGPSVILIRALDMAPEIAGPGVVACLREAGELLRRGALVFIDADGVRTRVLPVMEQAPRRSSPDQPS